MSSFKMRTTKPEAGNKYYITKANGGYSNAIKGSPVDVDCDVLSNCVGYAYGRFNEIGGYGYCKYLKPVNAENFIQYKDSVLKVGQTPKLGACMVWQRGDTLSGKDGAGHVAIVEKVISDTEVYTSESGWGMKPFWNQTRTKGNGNWGADAACKFLGFIYNPAVTDTTISTTPTSSSQSKPKSSNESPTKLNIGDEVRLISGATYTSGKSMPSWLFKKVLYVRDIRNNGDIVISTLKTGAVTGVVSSKYLTKNGQAVATTKPTTPVATKPSATTAPNTQTIKKFVVGDEVRLISGATYTSGKTIPAWVFKKVLYVREIRNDCAVISTLKTGAVTGVVALKYLTKI